MKKMIPPGNDCICDESAFCDACGLALRTGGRASRTMTSGLSRRPRFGNRTRSISSRIVPGVDMSCRATLLYLCCFSGWWSLGTLLPV